MPDNYQPRWLHLELYSLVAIYSLGYIGDTKLIVKLSPGYRPTGGRRATTTQSSTIVHCQHKTNLQKKYPFRYVARNVNKNTFSALFCIPTFYIVYITNLFNTSAQAPILSTY